MPLDFSAITAASATSTTAKPIATDGTKRVDDSAVGSQDYFLKLLVAQMNNQDPLNPMDSAQMTSQLAQLNTVQGINKLSTQLDTLLGDVTSAQSLQASSLVGHNALVPGNTLTLAGGMAVGGVELANDADNLTITIKNASGTVVRTLDKGKQEAGLLAFDWDGANDAGAAVAAGQYTFSTSAMLAKTNVVANALSFGQVSSVTPGSSGASVYVEGVGNVPLGQLKQIF